MITAGWYGGVVGGGTSCFYSEMLFECCVWMSQLSLVDAVTGFGLEIHSNVAEKESKWKLKLFFQKLVILRGKMFMGSLKTKKGLTILWGGMSFKEIWWKSAIYLFYEMSCVQVKTLMSGWQQTNIRGSPKTWGFILWGPSASMASVTAGIYWNIFSRTKLKRSKGGKLL